MQRVLYDEAMAGKWKLNEVASAAKAWNDLEERKRVLHNRPLVKPVEAKQKQKMGIVSVKPIDPEQSTLSDPLPVPVPLTD